LLKLILLSKTTATFKSDMFDLNNL